MTRQARRLGVVLLAAALLTGCTSSTAPGPVQPGLPVDNAPARPLGVFFPGPSAGATQEQVVRGFVRAGAASNGDYDIARAFLVPSTMAEWSPDREVVVFDTESHLRVDPVGPTSVRLTAPVLATVSAAGRYVLARPGTTRSVALTLERSAGEWRIGSLPEDFGRWLTVVDFSRLFAPRSVHYIARDRRALVADVRWFPLDRLTTRLARAQLDPVPAYLAPVVQTTVPAGVRLLVDSVPVTNGVATVNLSAGPAGSQEARAGFWAQLVQTLLQGPGVESVALQVAGASIDLPGASSPVATIGDVGFADPQGVTNGPAIVRRGTSVTAFQPDTDREVSTARPAATYPAVPAAYRHLALSAGGDEIAAVGDGGRLLSRWRGGTRYDAPRFAAALGSPAYDTRGLLWVGGVGAGSRSSVRLWTLRVAADPKATASMVARPVAAPWLSGRVVVESRPSPDGERVAVLSTDDVGKNPRLDVGGVVRDATGTPISLAPAVRLGTYVTGLRGLVWVSELSLASIGTDAGRPLAPYLLALNGTVSRLPDTPDGLAVTTTGGERNLVVLTARGTILLRAGQQWIETGRGLDVAVPAS